MTNPVYDMIAQTLSQKVSHTAAKTILHAVLKEQGLTAENVSVSEMQELLQGPLLGRLTAVLPPEQAREQVDELVQRLKNEFPKAPTLFTEVGAIWETGDNGEPSPPAMATSTPQTWEDPFEFAEDDFEFDDPEYQTAVENRVYDLNDTGDQERVIQDLGRMQGILGIMVTTHNGQLLQAKAIQEPSQLGNVIETIHNIFDHRLKLMSLDLEHQVVCLRMLNNFCIAIIANSNVNTGLLLAELRQIDIQG